MVVIRCRRGGKKNKPFFNIVVADSRRARNKKFIEALGHYDPITKKFDIDMENYTKWVNEGAQPSERVKSLLNKKHNVA